MKCDPDTLAYLELLETRVNDVMAKTSGGAGGIFFQQGGNSFGATGVLGTKDAFGLSVISNNLQFMAVSTAGATQLYSTGGITLSAANASGGPLPAVVGGALTLTGGTGGFALSSAAASTISTSVGAISVTSAAALTLTGTAASTWSTSAGNLSISAAAAQLQLSGVGAGNQITLGDGTHGISIGAASLPATGLLAIGAANAVTLFSNASTVTVTGDTGLTLACAAGPSSLDATGNGVSVGATGATALTIGNTTNLAAIALDTQAGLITTTAVAIAGGGAIPATLNYITVTINGTARKIPFASVA